MARAASTVCSLCEGVGTQRGMDRDGNGGWKHKPGECKAQKEAPVKDADADRARLATKRGTTMLGPAEQGRCEHGKLYSFRWKWPVGGTPEDSDVEVLSQGCKKCNAEDDSE